MSNELGVVTVKMKPDPCTADDLMARFHNPTIVEVGVYALVPVTAGATVTAQKMEWCLVHAAPWPSRGGSANCLGRNELWTEIDCQYGWATVVRETPA